MMQTRIARWRSTVPIARMHSISAYRLRCCLNHIGLCSVLPVWRHAWLLCALLVPIVWSGGGVPKSYAAERHYVVAHCATATFTWDAPTTWADGSHLTAAQILWYQVYVTHTEGLYEPAHILRQFKNDTTGFPCTVLQQQLGEDFQVNTTYYMVVRAEAKESQLSAIVQSANSEEISFKLVPPSGKVPGAPQTLRIDGAGVVIVNNGSIQQLTIQQR